MKLAGIDREGLDRLVLEVGELLHNPIILKMSSITRDQGKDLLSREELGVNLKIKFPKKNSSPLNTDHLHCSNNGRK